MSIPLSAEGRTPEASALPAKFEPEPEVVVRIDAHKGKIRLKIGKEKPVEIGELDPGAGMTGNKPVIIADFNFDGATDFAVLDGIGYNGVNMFYRLYLWEKGKGRFREIKEPIGNPVLDAKGGFILSAQRSGPRWYHTVYRVLNGEIYLFVQGQMLNNPTLWGITFPDQKGKAGKRAVVAAKWFDNPAAPVVPAEVNLSASTCKGEKAERALVVDFRDEGDEILIQVVSSKQMRWIGIDCLPEEK